MAHPTFGEVLQSDNFTFLIGAAKKPILVHSSALAAISEPIKSMMNQPMSESETRTANIPDLEVDDFVRFCEYAYRGNYSVPPCNKEETVVSSNAGGSSLQQNYAQDLYDQEENCTSSQLRVESYPEQPAVEEGYIDWDSYSIAPKKKKKGKTGYYEQMSPPKPSKKSIFREQFHDRTFTGLGDLSNSISSAWTPESNNAANEDFTPVFLAHTRLYRFADEKLVEPLKTLALYKLHRTLVDFKLFGNRVGDVLELARYAYSNDHTKDRADDGTIDELRKLVVDYIACEIDVIGKSKEFAMLMEDGGEFVGDFWSIARNHLF